MYLFHTKCVCSVVAESATTRMQTIDTSQGVLAHPFKSKNALCFSMQPDEAGLALALGPKHRPFGELRDGRDRRITLTLTHTALGPTRALPSSQGG